MFITNKLQMLFIGPAYREFNIQSSEHNDYITENFEIYAQQEKLLFNNNGVIRIDSQHCHLIQNTKTTHLHQSILIQPLIGSRDLWTKINDKRLALCNILTNKKK